MANPRIYIVRHGEATWNAERRWTGHSDPPLSERGRAEAKAACRTLAAHGFDSVVSSTRVRARETASIVAAELELAEHAPLAQLDERFAGPMSGMTAAEIDARWPGLLEAWRAGTPIEIASGEPWPDFVARVAEGIEQVRALPGRILVVAHMGVQRALEHATGRPLGRYANLEGLWVES